MSDLIAVIVETRELPEMDDIIDRHLKYLPENTPFANFGDKIKSDELDFRDYNKLLASEYFWNFFEDWDRVLIFQHDSGILREGIEEFMEWDYVGAPWPFQTHGGNGGFSLRNPKTMLEIIHKRKFNPSKHGNEDIYFCNYMHEHDMKLAPREVCSNFSVESILKYGTFGYHAIDKHFEQDVVNTILTQYE